MNESLYFIEELNKLREQEMSGFISDMNRFQIIAGNKIEVKSNISGRMGQKAGKALVRAGSWLIKRYEQKQPEIVSHLSFKKNINGEAVNARRVKPLKTC